ncbi:MAG: type II secretion system protein GspL [Gallionella sp.]|nr:type II secretion system protein GspL [Gallionella sp.]
MNTLYLRLPSQAAAGNAPNWPALPCAFALVSHDGTIARQGEMPLPELSVTMVGAQRVVLLLAAADVTLLRVKVPPLSPGRLKAALPNLVEDRLIGDPSACVIVAGGTHDGLRTVAAVQRTWLEHLAKTLIGLGARRIAAVPAQLCLSYPPDQVGQSGQSDQADQTGSIAAAISEHNGAIDLTLRLSEQDGIGLTIASAQDVAEGNEGNQLQQTAAHEAILALRAVVPEAAITLYVPQAELPAYQQAASGGISVSADNWTHWTSGGTALDLMAGLGAAAGPQLDWRAWRWPLALATAILLVNIAALNFDWWRNKTEANALRAAMTQIYKAAYPKETVIIDPIAQMRQKIAAAKRDAGLSSPDDFTMLAAAFGEASAGIMPGRASAIAALEYRERSLTVQLKPGVEAPAQQLKTALAERGLALEQTTSGTAVAWQIRSIK